MKKVIVLGGGLSGLGVAYKLVKDGRFKVTILEKEKDIGGLASSFHTRWDGKEYIIPKAYRHFIYDKDQDEILEDTKLKEQFKLKDLKIGVTFEGKVHDLSSAIQMLFLVTNYLGKDLPLTQQFKIFRSLISHPIPKKFVNAAQFDCKFEEFVKRLLKFLNKKGVKIKTNVKIEKIKTVADKSQVVYRERGLLKKEDADIIVSTIPPQTLCSVTEKIPKDIKNELKVRGHVLCTSVCIGLKKNFTDTYAIAVLDKDCHFSEIMNHTLLDEKSAPAGKSVIYLTSYGREIYQKSDNEIIKIFSKEISKLFPDFEENIEWYRVFRFEGTRGPLAFLTTFALGDVIRFNNTYVKPPYASLERLRETKDPFFRSKIAEMYRLFIAYGLIKRNPFGLLPKMGLRIAEKIIEDNGNKLTTVRS